MNNPHNLATSSNLYICLTAVALGLLLLLSQNPANPSGITVLGLICTGLGIGIGQPVALQAAVSSFAPEERGTGAGIVNSIRLAANAAGTAAAVGVLTLTMADVSTADTLNNIVKGASSCGVLASSTNLREASELCAVYTEGVKIIFLISLAMVFIVFTTVILWDLNSRRKASNK